MQEAILILANILKTYKLELEEGFVPDVVGRLTVRSANGMRIKFSKESHEKSQSKNSCQFSQPH